MTETVGVGLLGLGTVGSEVAARLIDAWELLGDRAGAIPVLRRVAVRDPRRQRSVNLRTVPVGDDAAAVVDDPSVRIVVEVMGGLDPATQLIERALVQGKHVVTANKAVVATAGPRLARLAHEHGCALRFEGAVGAGLPLLGLLQHTLLADRVTSIDCVINGTTNVILTRMRNDGVSLATAVREAQERGFAEADPSSDVEGWDAAYKLVILAWLAFGGHVDPEAVDRTGVGAVLLPDLAYSGQLGYTLKLVAHADRDAADGVHLRVRPTVIPETHALFGVDDSENAVLLRTDMADHVMVAGLGAGGRSTASAVVSDIVACVRDAPPVVPADGTLHLRSRDDTEVAGYVRLLVRDTPEATALIVQALEDRGVRVLETLEKPPLDGHHTQLVLLTATAPRAVHERALETLDSIAAVHEVAAAYDRIEPA